MYQGDTPGNANTQASFKPSHPNVLSGNPGVSTYGNVAMQQSLMTFLDEFTEVISGELRVLSVESDQNQLNKKG